MDIFAFNFIDFMLDNKTLVGFTNFSLSNLKTIDKKYSNIFNNSKWIIQYIKLNWCNGIVKHLTSFCCTCPNDAIKDMYMLNYEI